MRLTQDQQQRLREDHGICANECCDACGKVLNWLRYTRKDEKGEWCSRECRDGDVNAKRYATTRKTKGICRHCGLALPEDMRSGGKYCDSTCKKAHQRTKALRAA